MKPENMTEEEIRCEFSELYHGPERPKGMQGPEQGLVGESRSDRQQGTAEEAQPGERGVGDIALAVELRRHIERMRNEARQKKIDARMANKPKNGSYYHGKQAALEELREIVIRISKERSDLANVQVVAPPPQDSAST